MTPKRVVFYACGGGIGHFNRAYAIARELVRLSSLKPVILTTTPFIPSALQEQIPVWRLPSSSETEWLELNRQPYIEQLLTYLKPSALVVDTFPLGLEDELATVLPLWDGLKVLVQRDAHRAPPMGYYHHLVDPSPSGYGWVLNRRLTELWPREQARLALRVSDNKPVILVAHNGHAAETSGFFQQVFYALGTESWHLRFASLCSLEARWEPYQVHHYPLIEMMPGVDLVMGGGGYNLVAECRALGKKRLLRAFTRPFDRQDERLNQESQFDENTPGTRLIELVQQQLNSPPPLPESECQGAQYLAEWLKVTLQ